MSIVSVGKMALLTILTLALVSCQSTDGDANDDLDSENQDTSPTLPTFIPESGEFIITSDAILRSGPSVDSEQAGVLNQGEIIIVDARTEKGDWYRIKADQLWIAKTFISRSDEIVPEIPQATETVQEVISTVVPINTPIIEVSTITITPSQDCSTPPNWVIYIVQAGDTLSSLARRTNTTVQQIQKGNCLTGVQINVGQQLILPFMPTLPTAMPISTPTPTATLVPPLPTTMPIDTLTPTSTPTMLPIDTLIPTTTAAATTPTSTPTMLPIDTVVPTIDPTAPVFPTNSPVPP